MDKGNLIQTYIPPLSNNKDTGEESSYLHNRKHTHATRVQNTTLYSEALHTINNTVAKGFNQMASLREQSLDMSKAVDTINIHTLIRKLLQTNIPDTIIKFIANYIKESKAYTTYRNHTSSQRQFKTGLPQGGVLSPTLFNMYTSYLPPPSPPRGHGLRR